MPSKKFLREAMGVGADDAQKLGVSLNMFQKGKLGRHPRTRTFGGRNKATALMHETPRQALGRDVRDVRRIYMEDGLYGKEVREALQEVIRQNRKLHPGVFD